MYLVSVSSVPLIMIRMAKPLQGPLQVGDSHQVITMIKEELALQVAS
jgi:hypothetical protein